GRPAAGALVGQGGADGGGDGAVDAVGAPVGQHPDAGARGHVAVQVADGHAGAGEEQPAVGDPAGDLPGDQRFAQAGVLFDQLVQCGAGRAVRAEPGVQPGGVGLGGAAVRRRARVHGGGGPGGVVPVGGGGDDGGPRGLAQEAQHPAGEAGAAEDDDRVGAVPAGEGGDLEQVPVGGDGVGAEPGVAGGFGEHRPAGRGGRGDVGAGVPAGVAAEQQAAAGRREERAGGVRGRRVVAGPAGGAAVQRFDPGRVAVGQQRFAQRDVEVDGAGAVPQG